MKTAIAAFSLAAALAGCAAPYAPQDFDFSGLTSAGMVESISAAPRDIHAFEDAFVHEINPEVAGELLIRLDDGRAITLREDGTQHFAPGQRVRVVSGRAAPE